MRQFIGAVIKTLPFVVEQGSNIMAALKGESIALLNGLASSAGMVYRSLPRSYGSTPGYRSITAK